MPPKPIQPFKPFKNQLIIELSEVVIWVDGVKHVAYMAPDAAWHFINVVGPILFPDDGHVYLEMSSTVDVDRPWIVSYRAAQKKSNASLPGNSPHFFGLSFDTETTPTRAFLSLASDRVSKGVGCHADNTVVDRLLKVAWSTWKIGDKVSTVHLRNLLKSLGFTPHINLVREPWHYNIAIAGDSNGADDIIRRYPILEYNGSKLYKVANQLLAQACLQAITDPDTKLPLYQAELDGLWGSKSKRAWERFYKLWPAAFIRSSGIVEKGRMTLGMAPGKRGMRILQTFTADFKVVPPRKYL